MATGNHCLSLHHQSPPPFEVATRKNECSEGFGIRDGRIDEWCIEDNASGPTQVVGCGGGWGVEGGSHAHVE